MLLELRVFELSVFRRVFAHSGRIRHDEVFADAYFA